MAKKKKSGFAESPSRFQRRKPKPIESREQREDRKRRAVSVRVNKDILKVAREMKIDLSKVLERELDKLTVDERARQFYEKNKTWIDARNAYIEKHGTLTEQPLGPDAFDDPAT
jgi:post-segregation antitoxin (ccd killing protein)